jgi:heat shock protein HtpX
MIRNTFKTVFLMVLVAGLFMVVGQVLGGQTGLIIAFIFAFGLNFFSYWYSDKIVLKMYQAKEVTRGNAPKFYTMVEEITLKAGIPMPKVYIIPQMQPNAFATGRNPSNAAVACTQGILQSLNEQELRGVIAHEIAHIANRDILTQSIVATVVSAITILAQFAIFLPFGRSDDGPNPLTIILTLILAPIAAAMLQSALSQTREYEADRTAAELTGNPLSLANALRRLEVSAQQIPMQASEYQAKSTSHMFPVNPFSGRSISRLFSTHPPTEKRIAKLEGMHVTGTY